MSFQNSLFGCCSPCGTCCMAWLCPCILYGKTQARRENPAKRDPGCCNGSCMGWCVLSCFGFQGCLQCVTRGSLRNKYGIQSNCCCDCLVSNCCMCCALVQEAKEVDERESRAAAPVAYQPQPVPQMMYAPQQQQPPQQPPPIYQQQQQQQKAYPPKLQK